MLWRNIVSVWKRFFSDILFTEETLRALSPFHFLLSVETRLPRLSPPGIRLRRSRWRTGESDGGQGTESKKYQTLITEFSIPLPERTVGREKEWHFYRPALAGLSNFPFAAVSAAKGKFFDSASSASLRLVINRHFIVRQNEEYLASTR